MFASDWQKYKLHPLLLEQVISVGYKKPTEVQEQSLNYSH